MKSWPVSFTIDRGLNEPLFLQIARAITSDIRRGRLIPGSRLPGSRSLAGTMEVHRNTVLAAYRELEAEGWIQTSPRRGVFVSNSLPDPKPKRFARVASSHKTLSNEMPFELRPGPAPRDWTPDPKGSLVMGGGTPDVTLVPTELVSRAYRRVLRVNARSVLSYGDPRGHANIRVELAGMLAATRGLAIGEDDIVVTRGSQMALDLIARSLLGPGDTIAVESFGYGPAWEAFRSTGAEVFPVPVDEEGLVVSELEGLIHRTRIRAIYVTPHHQYPTTVVMTAGRRLALLSLARKHRFMIIEDDYHHEFHYDGRPVLPLASVDRGVVAYIGSLSKVLAPGMRLGYLVAPKPLLERVTTHRMYTDRQGDQAVECAIAELIRDGDLQRHIRRAKRIYQERRDLLAAELLRQFGSAISFRMPAGGMALWTKVESRINVESWAQRGARKGVIFLTAQSFVFDKKSRPYVRLGFGALTESQIREAVRRMVSVF